MATARILSIYLAPQGSAPMTAVGEVRALAGRGLEGDRYFLGTGSFSSKPGPSREVTLIEAEAVEAAARESGLSLSPGQLRRNLVTRNVRLNDLVDREFTVGTVRLRGIRLCQPCEHLEKLTQPGVQQAFRDRCGLRAQILTDGVIRAGDPVRESATGT